MALVIPPAPGQSTMQRPVVEDYLIDRWRRNMLEGAGGTRPATARYASGLQGWWHLTCTDAWAIAMQQWHALIKMPALTGTMLRACCLLLQAASRCHATTASPAPGRQSPGHDDAHCAHLPQRSDHPWGDARCRQAPTPGSNAAGAPGAAAVWADGRCTAACRTRTARPRPLLHVHDLTSSQRTAWQRRLLLRPEAAAGWGCAGS